MPVSLEIPDEAVRAMRLPTSEVQAELKKELAVALYARGVLSIGKSVEMADVTRQEFDAILTRRHVERPFDPAELGHELDWAKQGAESRGQ